MHQKDQNHQNCSSNRSKWVVDTSVWWIRFWSLDLRLHNWFINGKKVKHRKELQKVDRLGSEQINLSPQKRHKQDLILQNMGTSHQESIEFWANIMHPQQSQLTKTFSSFSIIKLWSTCIIQETLAERRSKFTKGPFV